MIISKLLLLIFNSLFLFCTICESANSENEDKNVTLKVNGSVAAVFTPVLNNQQQKLNYKIIKKYAKYLSDNHINGVLVSGTAGEYGKFSVEEKKLLLSSWLSAVKNLNLSVMMQVGGIPLPDAEELARFSEKLGVDAILTLPDSDNYILNKQSNLIYFLKRIAAAAPNTPLLYYHFPSETHVDLDMRQFFLDATKEIPTFKGMKTPLDSALNVQTLTVDDQRIFVAGLDSLGPAFLMGFDSFIMSEINIFPKKVNRILDSEECNLEKIRSVYHKLLDYKRAIVEGFEDIPAMKVAMKLVTGIDVGPARAPQRDLNSTQKDLLKKRLEDQRVKLKG